MPRTRLPDSPELHRRLVELVVAGQTPEELEPEAGHRQPGRLALRRPQTPYQRLLASGALSLAQRQALGRQLQTLDPIALAHDIQHTLDTQPPSLAGDTLRRPAA